MVKFYAVKIGKEGPQICSDWETCKKQVLGYPGAVYKSFPTLIEAQNFISGSPTQSGVPSTSLSSPIPTLIPPASPYSILKISEEFNTQQLPIIIGNPEFWAKISSLSPILIYTDGSASPLTQKAGAGIYFPQILWGLSVNVPGNQTNNRGELWSVIYGLEYIQAHFRGANLPPVEVIVYSDSTNTINSLVNNNVKNLDLIALLKFQKNFYPFRFIKVQAHSGDLGNSRADDLAKMASGVL